MKVFLVSLALLLVSTIAPAKCFSEASPLAPKCEESCSPWINEIGIVVPTKSTPLKDFFNSTGVNSSPLTTGLGHSVQFGRHLPYGKSSTVGAVANVNAFYSSQGASYQIYQASILFIGRAYLGESWRSGAFVELGAGPEIGGASLNGGSFFYQANIAARAGIGYNYKFNDAITVGATAVLSPSVTSGSITDGAKVVISMLW